MKFLKILAVTSLLITVQFSMANTFDGGLPSGWAVVGSAGISGANGVVTASPIDGSTAYGWVSTANSKAKKVGYAIKSETNGSSLTSTAFSTEAGEELKFYFNYVTSDGAGYSDYAFANLLNSSNGSIAAVLFNARTEKSGSVVPGNGLPTPVATLNPSKIAIIGGAPAWSPLGSYSGKCFSSGCGYTGWIESTYSIINSGTYELQFGVTNWLDTAYDSGLAFDGITINNTVIPSAPPSNSVAPPNSVPEPDTYATLLAGLGLMGFIRRRKTS